MLVSEFTSFLILPPSGLPPRKAGALPALAPSCISSASTEGLHSSVFAEGTKGRILCRLLTWGMHVMLGR